MKYLSKKVQGWVDQRDYSHAPRVCSSWGAMNLKSDQSAWLCVWPKPASATQGPAGRSEEVDLTKVGVFKKST